MKRKGSTISNNLPNAVVHVDPLGLFKSILKNFGSTKSLNTTKSAKHNYSQPETDLEI